LLDALTCASWLVYATRAEEADAVRIRDIVLYIKRDRLQRETRRPYVDIVVERLAARSRGFVTEIFGDRALLVPVPGSGLTKPRTVWPALSICQALLHYGFGTSVAPVLRRIRAVSKSAGSQERPSLDQHYRSLSVQGTFAHQKRIVLVDDVVTSGTTLMAGARRLHEAFPTASIVSFALARVQSKGEPACLSEVLIERVTIAGARCRRERET